MSIRVPVSVDESITVVESSVPATTTSAGVSIEPDVIAYFGVPSDDLAGSLDPTLVSLSIGSLGSSIVSYEGSLLRIQGKTFAVAGEIDVLASSASDLNQDGQIDSLDFSRFLACLSGPDGTPSTDCAEPGVNMEGHIDWVDVAQLMVTRSAYSQ